MERFKRSFTFNLCPLYRKKELDPGCCTLKEIIISDGLKGLCTCEAFLDGGHCHGHSKWKSDQIPHLLFPGPEDHDPRKRSNSVSIISPAP
jgi:hypothetical protein